MPAPYQGFYVASKHALEGYSEVLDLEVMPCALKVARALVPTSLFDRSVRTALGMR
jgi:short-subunit dehydrogenase